MTDPTPATGHEVAPPLTVITAPTGVTAAQVRVLLRTLAEVRDALRASAESGRTPRTWAWLGELAVDAGLTENEAVVEHDHVGRLAVRLAVDKTLCVGDSRSVRALTQGRSWKAHGATRCVWWSPPRRHVSLCATTRIGGRGPQT